MAEEKTGKVKVQRGRKRVYEASAEEAVSDALPEEAPVTAVVEAVAVAPETAVTEKKSRTLAELEQEPVKGETELFSDAMRLVRTSSAWAAGAGLVPIPAVDMIAMTAVQITMLKKLANLYGIPFSEQRSKSAVAALLGGVNAGYLGGSALKMFPVIGWFSIAAMPAVNGAITYAVGRVFIQHFASGGTFLDFDPAKVRAYFEEQYREGKMIS